MTLVHTDVAISEQDSVYSFARNTIELHCLVKRATNSILSLIFGIFNMLLNWKLLKFQRVNMAASMANERRTDGLRTTMKIVFLNWPRKTVLLTSDPDIAWYIIHLAQM